MIFCDSHVFPRRFGGKQGLAIDNIVTVRVADLAGDRAKLSNVCLVKDVFKDVEHVVEARGIVTGITNGEGWLVFTPVVVGTHVVRHSVAGGRAALRVRVRVRVWSIAE